MRSLEKSQNVPADAQGNAELGTRSAEYEAASRARSPADCIAKVEVLILQLPRSAIQEKD